MVFFLQTISATTIIAFVVFIERCHGLSTMSTTSDSNSSSNSSSRSMWHVFGEKSSRRAFQTIFGDMGDRGEYMDGYSKEAMIDRCKEDYKWERTLSIDEFPSERAHMMSHLYDNDKLWEHVSMVAFAEHYVLAPETLVISKPFGVFQRQKALQPEEKQIFGGVVWKDWEIACEESVIDQKLMAFRRKEIDYVRLELNFGTVNDIKGPEELSDNKLFYKRFDKLAKAAKGCQEKEMVPVVLLQVPWRDSGVSQDYFDKAVQSFANALLYEGVDPQRLILETRPPIGMSAQSEKGISGSERRSLGYQIGCNMFEAIDSAFTTTLAGFCVAGGSTKGNLPTAMEDDTQNAVRQGMRESAQESWGFSFCFWEMGAKLMLTPKIGRLWASHSNDSDAGSAGHNAARELFCVNAQDMADEIQQYRG